MAYTRQRAQWLDYPDLSTLIRAADLQGMETGIVDAHNKLTREEIRNQARGFIVEAFDPVTSNDLLTTVSGRVYVYLVGLKKDDVITNLHAICTTAGATQTLVKMGLYTKTFTQLAVSADVKTTFETTGLKTIPMISAYTVLADDAVYLAFLAVGGTQPVVISERGGINSMAASPGSGSLRYAAESSQTDLDPTISPTATSDSLWMAAS